MAVPEVLVVLPTLGDRLDTLRETLESVRAQQVDVALTLAVVVPAGATQARALAAEFGAVVVDDPKTGISAAINFGLAARTHEKYYAWIGDDDIFRPGGLGTLKAILEKRPDAVLAFGPRGSSPTRVPPCRGSAGTPTPSLSRTDSRPVASRRPSSAGTFPRCCGRSASSGSTRSAGPRPLRPDESTRRHGHCKLSRFIGLFRAGGDPSALTQLLERFA